MSKPKANRIIKKLDDFVDNNQIYILVITYIINYNYNIRDIRNNKYQNFLRIYIILNINKKIIFVESKIKTLYQSLV